MNVQTGEINSLKKGQSKLEDIIFLISSLLFEAFFGDQLIGMIDTFIQFLIWYRTIDNDRIPMFLVHVITGLYTIILLP